MGILLICVGVLLIGALLTWLEYKAGIDTAIVQGVIYFIGGIGTILCVFILVIAHVTALSTASTYDITKLQLQNMKLQVDSYPPPLQKDVYSLNKTIQGNIAHRDTFLLGWFYPYYVGDLPLLPITEEQLKRWEP